MYGRGIVCCNFEIYLKPGNLWAASFRNTMYSRSDAWRFAIPLLTRVMVTLELVLVISNKEAFGLRGAEEYGVKIYIFY